MFDPRNPSEEAVVDTDPMSGQDAENLLEDMITSHPEEDEEPPSATSCGGTGD